MNHQQAQAAYDRETDRLLEEYMEGDSTCELEGEISDLTAKLANHALWGAAAATVQKAIKRREGILKAMEKGRDPSDRMDDWMDRRAGL